MRFLRGAAAAAAGPGGTRRGRGEGWAVTGSRKAGTEEGFPASAHLPKQRFIWWLMKKVHRAKLV